MLILHSLHKHFCPLSQNCFRKGRWIHKLHQYPQSSSWTCALDKIHFLLINHCNLINHSDSNLSYHTLENRNNQPETCPVKIFLHCAKWPFTNNIRCKKCDHLKMSKNTLLFVGIILKNKEIFSSNPFTGTARQQCACHVLTLLISRQDTGKWICLGKSAKNKKKNQFQKGPNTEWPHLKMGTVVQHIPKKKCYFCVWRQF